MKIAAAQVWANDDTLYFVDNGACYCGAHLGSTARHTGRDLSGQQVLAVTPDVVSEADAMGFAVTCEVCGKKPSRLFLAEAR